MPMGGDANAPGGGACDWNCHVCEAVLLQLSFWYVQAVFAGAGDT
jgi:hypothetical protein